MRYVMETLLRQRLADPHSFIDFVEAGRVATHPPFSTFFLKIPLAYVRKLCS